MTFNKYKMKALLLGVTLSVALMAGCTPTEVNQTGETQEVITQEDKVEKEIKVVSEKVSEITDEYTIEIDMPILQGFENEAFEKEQNEEMTDGALEYAESIKKMALETKEEGFLTSPFYFGITYEVVMQNEHYLTLGINYNEYMGGAHGNYLMTYSVYDLEEEKVVALKDIVKTDTDYMAVINEAILEAINEERATSEYGEDLHSWYEGVEEESLEFFLSPDGFGVQFQPYEIGPYAEGAPSYIIPYERLKKVLNLKSF